MLCLKERVIVELNWFFWGATAFFMLFELTLSYAYAESPLMPEKGLITDIAAAASIWALSLIVYFTASASKTECSSWGQLPGFDINGCLNYTDKVYTVGDVLNSTIGLNPIIAATVFYFLIKLAAFIYSRVKT
jgi:hypothetical protein